MTWHRFGDVKPCLGLQVNGKVRGNIEIAKDASEEEAVALALASANVQKHTDGKAVAKVIYKAGRILNIVVKG